MRRTKVTGLALLTLFALAALFLFYHQPARVKFAVVMGGDLPEGVTITHYGNHSTFSDAQYVFAFEHDPATGSELSGMFGFTPGGQDYPGRQVLRQHLPQAESELEGTRLYFVRKDGRDCYLYMDNYLQYSFLAIQGY